MVAARSDEQVRALQNHIQELLDRDCERQRFPFRLRVLGDALQEGQWITFAVVPEGGEVGAYEYAAALADVETELARDEKEESVLLVPAIPD